MQCGFLKKMSIGENISIETKTSLLFYLFTRAFITCSARRIILVISQEGQRMADFLQKYWKILQNLWTSSWKNMLSTTTGHRERGTMGAEPAGRPLRSGQGSQGALAVIFVIFS